MKVKVAQLCLTLCNLMDYTVHGILQARIPEWVAFTFSRAFSQPRDRTQVFCIAGRFFTSWTTRDAQINPMKQILIHFLEGKKWGSESQKRLSNLAEDEIIPKPRSVKLHLKTQQIHIFRSRNKGFSDGLAVKNLLAIQETQFQPVGQEDLEKEVATCSTILAWKIPWTEELGGLRSTGLQRVGHDCGTEHVSTHDIY